jgi:hypothetical protein
MARPTMTHSMRLPEDTAAAALTGTPHSAFNAGKHSADKESKP